MTDKRMLNESCVWVREGDRYICMTYTYHVGSGLLYYGACIYNCSTEEIGVVEMEHCKDTATRRYNIRPVVLIIDSHIGYDKILKEIMKLICSGHGCKGIRKRLNRENEESSDSSTESLSDSVDYDSVYKVEPYIHGLEEVYYGKYFHSENYIKYGYNRVIYMAFKVCKETGQLLYGASIYRDRDITNEKMLEYGHYDTAFKRLNKSPVHLLIPEEYRNQLDLESSHYEDIYCIIIDKIFDRKGGRLQIRTY